MHLTQSETSGRLPLFGFKICLYHALNSSKQHPTYKQSLTGYICFQYLLIFLECMLELLMFYVMQL